MTIHDADLDEQRVRQQRAELTEIRRMLQRVAPELVQRMVEAFVGKEGLKGWKKREAAKKRERGELLRKLLRSEQEIHRRLHTLYGEPLRMAKGGQPWGRSKGGARKRPSAFDYSYTACDVLSGCSSHRDDIRKHGEVCIWLKKLVAEEQARDVANETFRGVSESKDEIVREFRSWGLTHKQVALLILWCLREEEDPLPFDDTVLDKQHDALRHFGTGDVDVRSAERTPPPSHMVIPPPFRPLTARERTREQTIDALGAEPWRYWLTLPFRRRVSENRAHESTRKWLVAVARLTKKHVIAAYVAEEPRGSLSTHVHLLLRFHERRSLFSRDSAARLWKEAASSAGKLTFFEDYDPSKNAIAYMTKDRLPVEDTACSRANACRRGKGCAVLRGASQ